jgi:hypothetical protein
MGLYQLCYRVGGAFEGVAFVEASSLGAALWQADRQGLDPGGERDGIELHPDDARLIPRKFIGRLLGEDEVADLDRVLCADIRKRPPAQSVRRPRAKTAKIGA